MRVTLAIESSQRKREAEMKKYLITELHQSMSSIGSGVGLLFQSFHQWLYRGGRPNALARALNWFWAALHSFGIAPNYMVTLEVVGRRSRRVISFPLAMVLLDGERYLVSMLGNRSAWVQNVRAAGGRARLRHGLTEQVLLQEVPVEKRAAVLKAYLRIAPGARPHIPVDMDAPLEEFEEIAATIPVFRLISSQMN
jgi:hypothetical protein